MKEQVTRASYLPLCTLFCSLSCVLDWGFVMLDTNGSDESIASVRKAWMGWQYTPCWPTLLV